MGIDIRIVGHKNLNVDLCHSGSVFDRNNCNFADIYSHPVFKRKVFQTEKKMYNRINSSYAHVDCIEQMDHQRNRVNSYKWHCD